MRFAFQLILVSSCTKYNPLGKGTFKDRKQVVVVVGLLLATNSGVVAAEKVAWKPTRHQGSEASSLEGYVRVQE